jgi:hypothetical protein
MDQKIVDYCKGTTQSNPTPVGTFSISHTYDSLAQFQADVPNGEVCVNGYDIHQQDPKSNDWNPGKNGDNTLKAGQYVASAMCSTATHTGVKGKKIKKVHHKAKPTKPTVAAASFTG